MSNINSIIDVAIKWFLPVGGAILAITIFVFRGEIVKRIEIRRKRLMELEEVHKLARENIHPRNALSRAMDKPEMQRLLLRSGVKPSQKLKKAVDNLSEVEGTGQEGWEDVAKMVRGEIRAFRWRSLIPF